MKIEREFFHRYRPWNVGNERYIDRRTRQDIAPWAQKFANVLGIPVHILATEQGPSYGAAILAMVGCGVYRDVAEATDRIVVTAQVLYPQQEKVLLYNNKYLLYKQLYPALKRYFEATKND